MPDSKVALQALEVPMGQGFGEDIRSVVLRVHVHERGSAFLNQVVDVVEFYPDVLDIRMAYVILHQSSSGIVVT